VRGELATVIGTVTYTRFPVVGCALNLGSFGGLLPLYSNQTLRGAYVADLPPYPRGAAVSLGRFADLPTRWFGSNGVENSFWMAILNP